MKNRMKNVAVMVFSLTLTGALLTGCGESRQARQDTQQGISTSISEETEQDSIAEKAEAELTAFPVYVGLPDVGVVETKEDFLKLDAEAVFTDELLKSIEKADIENFQPSMAGFPISDGRIASINFGVIDGVLAVNAINY